MSKQTIRKPLSIALGAAVVTSLGLSGMANASDIDEDLFSMEELNSGYLTAGGHEKDDGDDKDGDDKDEGEGSCGEGKCGGAS
jgi:uncharacterized low-complexity protein